jgi:hypothetical protein
MLTKLGIASLVFGGLILWNTWVFGFLNHGIAGYTQMSISELNVAGQPFAWFFTATEWLSGIFIILGCCMLMLVRGRGKFMLLALILTAAIGGLTIFDATHTLDCNRYQNPTCALKWTEGKVTTTHKEHGVESQITDYVTILLGITLVLWAIYHTLSKDAPYVELALVLILALAIAGPILVSSKNIVIESLGQRLWNSLTSVAFLYIAYKARRLAGRPDKNYSQRKTRKAIA